MTDLLEPETPAITLSEAAPQTSKDLPDWFHTARVSAWQNFQNLPAPVRTDENWRYSDLKRMDISAMTVAENAAGSMAETEALAFPGLVGAAASCVFLNDTLVLCNPLPADLLEKGVLFLPLEEALQTHGDLIRQYFAKQEPQLGSERFAALHRSRTRAGVFVHVPEGVQIDAPVEVFHWIAGTGQAVFPHTLVVAGEDSRVTVIDHYRSNAGASNGFACAMTDLHAEARAKLTHVCVQNWEPSALSVQLNTTEVGGDASIIALNLNLGARTARVESRSVLKGTGGRSDMLAVSIGEEDQHFDLRTLQDHLVRNCVSDLLYKNALAGSARAIFSGLIRVEPGAHQTDAYQTNRSLLLSDNAESVSMPGLEILADDVKCSHGSTTSDLDEDEMFYLLARGISRPAARRLLVMGFLNEVIQRLDNPVLEAHLLHLVETRFATIRS